MVFNQGSDTYYHFMRKQLEHLKSSCLLFYICSPASLTLLSAFFCSETLLLHVSYLSCAKTWSFLKDVLCTLEFLATKAFGWRWQNLWGMYVKPVVTRTQPKEYHLYWSVQVVVAIVAFFVWLIVLLGFGSLLVPYLCSHIGLPSVRLSTKIWIPL